MLKYILSIIFDMSRLTIMHNQRGSAIKGILVSKPFIGQTTSVIRGCCISDLVSNLVQKSIKRR